MWAVFFDRLLQNGKNLLKIIVLISLKIDLLEIIFRWVVLPCEYWFFKNMRSPIWKIVVSLKEIRILLKCGLFCQRLSKIHISFYSYFIAPWGVLLYIYILSQFFLYPLSIFSLIGSLWSFFSEILHFISKNTNFS